MMLTVKECLRTVAVRKFNILTFLDEEVGCITKEYVDDETLLIFSRESLLDILNMNVCKIEPMFSSCDKDHLSCNLVLDVELPFYQAA